MLQPNARTTPRIRKEHSKKYSTWKRMLLISAVIVASMAVVPHSRHGVPLYKSLSRGTNFSGAGQCIGTWLAAALE